MAGEDDKVFDLLERPREKNWEFMEEDSFQKWMQESYEKDEGGEAINLIKSWLDAKYFPEEESGEITRTGKEVLPPTDEGGHNLSWQAGYVENIEEIVPYLKDYYYENYVKPVKFPKIGI